jgi:hypothetical protein
MTPSPHPLPLEGGEGFSQFSPLPVGEGWVRALFSFFTPHTTHRHILVKPLSRFGSAFAMEVGRVGAADLRRDHVRP